MVAIQKNSRLMNSVDWSIKELAFPRKERLRLIEQFVGSHYGEGGSGKRVPVNSIEMAVTIYLQNLAARAPRAMVTTGSDQLKPLARNMELALDMLSKEIDLGETIEDAVAEAIFSIGVVKVGITTSRHSYLGHDVGEPFVDVVSLDDYFLDMSAKKYDSIQYEGNDYWVDIEAAREINEAGAKVEPDDHTVHGDQGEERAEQISTGEGAETFRDRVQLRDIWLPNSQTIETYSVRSKELYRIVDWDGPERGPYHTLRYTNVPGNLLPLAPAMLWIDLHELSNSLFRKLSKQAIGKKTVVTFSGGDDKSAEALKSARDGEAIRYDGTEPKEITVGGIDAPGLAFYLQTNDQLNRFAGNLDALGGLGPQSETATQDKLLTSAAGARMDRMKASTIKFVAGIFKSLAFYEWTDPVSKRVVEKKVEGSDIVIRADWSAETRDADFLDFNLDIDPYSMEQDTPATRLGKIGEVMDRFIIPLLPMFQQQGAQIDVRKMIEIVSRLANVDEMREIVIFSDPIPGAPAQGGGQPSFAPANTTRTNIRVNRPGSTRQGRDDVMSRFLMGAGVQESEAAAIGRPTS